MDSSGHPVPHSNADKELNNETPKTERSNNFSNADRLELYQANRKDLLKPEKFLKIHSKI